MPAPDPYLPGHGDTRYRVHHYDLRLVYRVSTNRLDEVATLQVEMLEDCTHLELDLVGLQASRVVVDGRRVRHRRRDRKLVLELPASSAGARHVVQVHCAGKPRPVPGAHGSAGWEELTDGVLVGSQPYGAPGWFPCNDDAAGKATFRIQLDVASGYHVVANGTLAERQQRGGTTRWTYLMDAPMAPYLASVHIGRYVVEPRAAGVPVELVHPPDLAVGAGTAFEHQAEMVELFSSLFGPYPFDCYRAVVTDDALEIPLEAQGLSSFGRNFAQPTWDNERLVAHELAHQWFGNSLTATTLSGIWLHEGFACYAEWLWAEHRSADGGIGGVQEQAARHHAALVRERHQQLTPLSDPGMRDMFDDWVYKRGALALHAVRCVLGSEAFFEMLRCWTQRHRHSVVTTQDFAEHCAGFAGPRADELRATLSSWLDRTALPPLPVLRG